MYLFKYNLLVKSGIIGLASIHPNICQVLHTVVSHMFNMSIYIHMYRPFFQYYICRAIIRFLFFQIAGSSSWHARFSVLTYLQIMVFYNLFTILSNEQAVQDVRALVIRLLEDEQLEVPFGQHTVTLASSFIHFYAALFIKFSSICIFVSQVREMAATTLSGFLQCNFLAMDASMQTHFEALCKTRLPKKRKRGSVVDTIPSVGMITL